MNEYLLEGTPLTQWSVAQLLEAPAMKAGDLDSTFGAEGTGIPL